MRLDKYLGHAGIGTRTEIQKMIKKKLVTVDGVVANKANMAINPDTQQVYFNNHLIEYKEFYYFILNKPAGVISATSDSMHETVIDLLYEEDQNKKVAPVGRLDKDTEGLLILTNDGKMAHKLLSPKKHIEKVYYAVVSGKIVPNAVEQFENGITLEDDTECKPAGLEIISQDEDEAEVFVTLTEGKFHQVKRMINVVGGEVTFLQRVKMGNLELPDDLECGEYRELTDEELLLLQGEDDVFTSN